VVGSGEHCAKLTLYERNVFLIDVNISILKKDCVLWSYSVVVTSVVV
jgi:hypothetical protein